MQLKSRHALVVFLAGVTASAQTPVPQRAPEAKAIAELPVPLRNFCETHFAGLTQSLTKGACLLGAITHKEMGRDKALNECRKVHQTQTSTDLACQIGVAIATIAAAGTEGPILDRFKKCTAYFPLQSELDHYLRESCVFGVFLAHDAKMAILPKGKIDLCERFSKEKSFLGPCGVGVSLTLDNTAVNSIPTDAQSHVCLRHFDQQAFHQGYRACMNARALTLQGPIRAKSIARDCKALTAGRDGTEHASCIVGGSIVQNLQRAPDGRNPRFEKCGDGKVNWMNRDYLMCLTAASLLDFGDQREARASCKSLFPGRRSRLRNECADALAQLAVKEKAPQAKTKVIQPVNDPDGTADEVWPEAPDNATETADTPGDDDASETPPDQTGPVDSARTPASD